MASDLEHWYHVYGDTAARETVEILQPLADLGLVEIRIIDGHTHYRTLSQSQLL
jgi:alpha-galactosidase